MPIYALGDRVPQIHPTAFIHPDSVVIGDVTIGAESTIWPSAVLRGDHGSIIIGSQTSIQDGTVIHCTGQHPTIIGNRCVVGHNAHLEGCTVEDNCLIGSGSVILHRAHVGLGALVAASAMVPNDTQIPSYAMALGVPCKIRENAVEAGSFDYAVELYSQDGHMYRSELRQLND